MKPWKAFLLVCALLALMAAICFVLLIRLGFRASAEPSRTNSALACSSSIPTIRVAPPIQLHQI
jgi:hypothetical protein